MAGRAADDVVSVRAAAMRALEAVAEAGDAAVAAAAGARLEDTDAGVRRAAAQTLRRAALQGDAVARAAVAARLLHASPSVRLTALVALAQLAEEGEEEGEGRRPRQGSQEAGVGAGGAGGASLDALCACLADEDATVRRAAVRVLARAAERGGAVPLAGVTKCLGDPSPGVRYNISDYIHII